MQQDIRELKSKLKKETDRLLATEMALEKEKAGRMPFAVELDEEKETCGS